MAENPALWGEATKVIDEIINDHFAPENRERCGFSLAMGIADALRKAGFLDYEDIWTEDTRTPKAEPPFGEVDGGAWG